MKSIILVGGEGTRLRPLTYSTVKAMVPVLNEPFIEYVIRHLSSHGVSDIILALGHKPDCIRDHFGHVSRSGTRLFYSVEPTPLGTAGAVKYAEQHVNDAIFVVNGDIFSDIDLSDMLRFHKKKRAKATIALTAVEDPTHFGVVEIDNEHRVTRFVEKPRHHQVTSNLINAGVYILEYEIIRHMPLGFCMFEHDVFPKLVAAGDPVFGYVTNAYWIDTGTVEKYLQLNRDLLHGKSSQVCRQAKDISINKESSVHPQAKLSGPILIDKGCTIGKGVTLNGPVVIGSSCTVHDGTTIENSILWQNVTVGEQALLTDCVIASDTIVESNAHIKGTAISAKAHAHEISAASSAINSGG